MLTWSLWILLVWWFYLSINNVYIMIKYSEEIEGDFSMLIFSYVVLPAPIVLLDYLI